MEARQDRASFEIGRALELGGYRDVELPEYRRLPAVIQLDGVTMTHAISGQQIGPHHFPADIRDTIKEEQPFGQAIGEIEAMLVQGKANGGFMKLAPPQSQLLVSMLNHENSENGIEGQRGTAVYWVVSIVSLEGLLDQVRSRLVRLVAEMKAGMPPETSVPTPEVADNAVQVVVHGKKSTVNVTTAQASGSGSHNVSASPTAPASRTPWWRSLWALLVGLAGIVVAVVTVLIWQGWKF